MSSGIHKSKKEATEAWNTRHSELILRHKMERMESDRHWFTLDEQKPNEEQHVDVYDPMGGRWTDVVYRDGRFLYDQMNDQYLLEREVVFWKEVPNLAEIRLNRKRAAASNK
jgi:hypothetical protein